jgi:hypothetical protein
MRCERCAGLLVAEQFIGGGTFIGGWAYGGWRCVNCGAVGLSGQAGAHHVMQNVTGGEKHGRQSRAPSTKYRGP